MQSATTSHSAPEPDELRAARAETERRLRDAGIVSAKSDAAALVSWVSAETRAGDSSPAWRDQLEEMATRRSSREPMEYLLGRCAFRTLELQIDRRVIIPKEESAALVDIGLSFAAPGARVHEVGTGSGAVALALKHERPDLVVSGSDVSAEAIDVARANADRLGLDVEFIVYDATPPGPFDLVLTLPPISPADHAEVLPDEVLRHEPSVALFGGSDGLDVVRSIVVSAQPRTKIVIGHFEAQRSAVWELLEDPESAALGRQTQRRGGELEVPAYTVGRVPVSTR